MKTEAFLRRLQFSLDFMTDEEREKILEYYYKKIMNSSDEFNQEEYIKSLGVPEKIAQNIKIQYEQILAEENDLNENLSEKSENSDVNDSFDDDFSLITDTVQNNDHNENNDSVEISDADSSDDDHSVENSENFDENRENPTENKDSTDEVTDQKENEINETVSSENEEFENQDDLIFRKEDELSLNQEIIHSIESKEITPLFTLENTSETQIDPDSEKVQTLEKAFQFEEGLEQSFNNDDSFELEAEEVEEDEYKEPVYVPGFLESRLKKGTSSYNLAIISLSIIFSPLLLALFLGLGMGFIIAEGFIIFSSVALFLLMVTFAVIGAVEIIYGISVMLSSILSGLIEIGLGLVFLALCLAFVALIYQYIFAIVPKFIKNTFKFFKKITRKAKNAIWGGMDK